MKFLLQAQIRGCDG